MSGGSYEYAYIRLEDLAEEIKARSNHITERILISKYLLILSKIMHDVEWYDSADYGEDSWQDIDKLLLKFSNLSKLDLKKIQKAEKFDLITKLIEENAL